MPAQHDATTNRRAVLSGVGAGLASLGFAGCLDGEAADDGDDPAEDADGEDDATSSDRENGDANSSDATDETDGEGAANVHEEYESTDVRVTTPDGDELGSVTAAIADTDELRRLGLSETAELPEDRGMLFVYDEVDERTFGMPDMSFGIDIVFADDEGVITSIDHAPAPDPDEDGTESDHRYPGRGQYVLEVVYEWTTERGVEAGDVLEFDL
ncbi:DUF192 domain-containing protein [Natrononativus amylolyticus]|uniref:DUF192 domain-containing protein n=1 Tax=Natrononativus amylolyticus TaxID=2963434 RepID=UPI0020CF5397|nr:DUF192 domain-containing protein [Natrononativus amylolyticus]